MPSFPLTSGKGLEPIVFDVSQNNVDAIERFHRSKYNEDPGEQLPKLVDDHYRYLDSSKEYGSKGMAKSIDNSMYEASSIVWRTGGKGKGGTLMTARKNVTERVTPKKELPSPAGKLKDLPRLGRLRAVHRRLRSLSFQCLEDPL